MRSDFSLNMKTVYETGFSQRSYDSFCPYSLFSHLNLFEISPPESGCSKGLEAFSFFFKKLQNIPHF